MEPELHHSHTQIGSQCKYLYPYIYFKHIVCIFNQYFHSNLISQFQAKEMHRRNISAPLYTESEVVQSHHMQIKHGKDFQHHFFRSGTNTSDEE